MHARTHKGTHFTSAGHWTLLIEHWQCYSHSFWESKYFFYLLTFRKLYYSQKTIYFLSYCGCAELKIRLCYLLIMILDSPMNVLKNSYYSKLTFAKNLFFFSCVFLLYIMPMRTINETMWGIEMLYYSLSILVSELQMVYCEALSRNLVKESWHRSPMAKTWDLGM